MSNKLLLHMDGVLVDKSSNNMSVSGSPSFVSEGLSTSASSFSASYTATNSFTVSFFATVNSSGTEASPNTLFNFGDFPLQVGLSSSNELVITFRNYKWKLPSAYGFSYGSKNHYSLMVDMSSSGGSRLFVNGSYNTPFYAPTVSEIAAASSGKSFGSSVSLGSGGSYYIKEFRIDDGYVNIFETQKARLKAGFNGTLADSSSFANAAVYTAQSGSATPSFAPFLSATVAFSAAPASGTFKFTYGGSSTAAINWNDSAATIQSKLRALARMEDAVVSGSISGGLSIACGYIGTGLTATANSLGVTITVTESQDTSNRAWTSVTLNNNIGKIAYSDFKFGGYSDFTIDMKAKLMPISSPSERTFYKVLSIGGDVNNNFAFSLLYNTTTYSAGKFRITRTVSGVATNYDFGSGFTPNKEIHLALVLNGLTLTVYVNGTSQGIYTFSSSDFFFQQGLILNPDYSFNGTVNDFRITNYVVYSGDFSSDRTKSLDNTNYSDIQPKTFTFPVSSLATPSNAIDQGAVLAAGGAGYPGSYPTGINDPGLSVTYIGNSNTGGSAPIAGSYSLDGTATISSGSGLSRTHYTFGGWNTAADGSGTTYSSGSSLSLGLNSFNLYALWIEDPKYSVTYYANNGTGAVPVDSATYYVDGSVSVQGAGGLTREHYTFGGWNTAADGSGTSYNGGGSFSMGSGNVSLYAVWTENATYHITYHANGASGSVPVDSNTYYSGDSTSVAGSGSLSKTNYSFSGWSLSPNGSIVSTITISGDIDLYAIFTENPKYHIYYDGKGSEQNIPSNQYYVGSQFNLPSAVTKYGYIFQGWATATDYPTNGTLYQAENLFTMPSSNVMMYAYWSIAPTYNIHYFDNGGTGIVYGTTDNNDPNNYYQGDTVTIFSDTGVTRTGYYFSGWNTAADGSGTSYTVGQFITIGASDIDLYAQWSLVGYKVYYNANDGIGTVIDNNTYHYNDSVIISSESGISRSNYRFMSWNTAADGSGSDFIPGNTGTMPASDVTLYAKWARVYSVIYDANGGHGTTIDSNTYLPGETVTIYNCNDLEIYNTGKHFYTWNTNANSDGNDYSPNFTITMPASDLTLYAIWGNEDVITNSFLMNFDDPIYVLNQTNNRNQGIDVKLSKYLLGQPGTPDQTLHILKDSLRRLEDYSFTYGKFGDGILNGYAFEMKVDNKKAIQDIFSLAPESITSFPGDFTIEWSSRVPLDAANNSNSPELGSMSDYKIFEFETSAGLLIQVMRMQALTNNRDVNGNLQPRLGYCNYKLFARIPKTDVGQITMVPVGYGCDFIPANNGIGYDGISIGGTSIGNYDAPFTPGAWDNFKVSKSSNRIIFSSDFGPSLSIEVGAIDAWYEEGGWVELRLPNTYNFQPVSLDEIKIYNHAVPSYVLNGTVVTTSKVISLDQFYELYPNITPHVGDRVSSSKEILNGGIIVYVDGSQITINEGSKIISNMSLEDIGKTNIGDMLHGPDFYEKTFVVGIGSDYIVLNTAAQPSSGIGGGSRVVTAYGQSYSSTNLYNISYNNNNGSGSVVDNNSYEKYSSIIIKSHTGMSRSGYTFDHWNTVADGSGASYYENQIIQISDSSLTLYAVWIEGQQSQALSLQVKKKFINNSNIDETKILFNNDAYFKSLKSDASEKEVFKVNAQDKIEFADEIVVPAATADENMVNKGQLTDAVAAEESRAVAAESSLSAAIAAEASRAAAAESSISSAASAAVAAEQSRAVAAEASIAASVAAEVSRATAAEGSLQSQINSIDSGSSASTAAEESRAMAAEAGLSADISAEVSRAMAAEGSLSSDIAAEQSRATAAEGWIQSQVDSIVSNTDPAALDSLTEIVNAFQNADSTITNTINNLSSDSAAAVAAEESRAMAAEGVLTSDLAAEVSRATVAEGQLSSDLAAEVSRAMAAEGVLTSDLAAEVSRAMAAEGVLTSDLAAEVSRATAAEGSLSAAVAAEESRATAAESSLSAAIVAEASRAAAAEAGIAADLAAEESRAMAAEGMIILESISAEVSRAMAAEGVLTSDLAAEQSRAMAAEAGLSSDIAAEQSRAMAAEGSLQSQINSIISNNDPAMLDSMTEIVAAFQAADGNLSTVVSNLASSVAADLAAEQSRATAAEGSLSSDLAAEESRAIAAEAALGSRASIFETMFPAKESFVLTAQDITNGYIDLVNAAITKSTFITADRLPIHEGQDYTVSLVSNKTRITFIGPMIGSSEEALVAGDTVSIEYMSLIQTSEEVIATFCYAPVLIF